MSEENSEETPFKYSIDTDPIWTITQDGVVRTEIVSRGIFDNKDKTRDVIYRIKDPYNDDEIIQVKEDYLFEDFVRAAKSFYEAFAKDNS